MTAEPSAALANLSRFDTPSVGNAREIVVPARRGSGFTVRPPVCLRPEQPPAVGEVIHADRPGAALEAPPRPGSDPGFDVAALARAWREQDDIH